jgi:hypothetical protein
MIGLVAVAALSLLGAPGTVSPAGPEEPASGAFLPTWFPGMTAGMQEMLPFLRDTQLLLHFRTFYRNNEASPGTFQEAWAAGGLLAYRSGWLAEVFSVGAAGYFSLPVYAPDDRDGTLLLKPGQDPIAVLGEAWAKLRYGDHVLTGYRQLINVGYVNPQDNRMIPNTFEAVMLDDQVGWFDYHTGYLFGIKPREEDSFLSIAERAGAADFDAGMVLVGLRAAPWKPLVVEANTAYGIDTYNSAFVQADYTIPLAERIALTVGAQYHDQRSVGDELVGGFDTWNVGLGLPGLIAYFWFAEGTGAINPATGLGVPDRQEYDFDVAYTFPSGCLKGLQLRTRVALNDLEGTPGLLPDVRLILNWPLPLL